MRFMQVLNIVCQKLSYLSCASSISTMNNPFQTCPRLSVAATVVLILLFYKGLHIALMWIGWNSMSCYYAEVGDALPAAENLSLSPNTRSIFFLETSCRGGLTVRQACAVESAARAHPQLQIYVLFSSPVTHHALKTTCLAKLLQFHNIKLLRVHVAEYSKGTDMESILLNDLKNSRYPIEHLADILRILTLNKWGGIYLDTDMIVTRSLEQLPLNFVAKQSNYEISSGILAFAKDEIGTNITNSIMREMSKDYRPDIYLANGIEIVDKVIRELCPKVVNAESYETKPFHKCEGVFIFEFELFYPMFYTEVDYIFGAVTEVKDIFDLERPYTYHMWNFLTYHKKIYKDTVYETVAKKFCPTIHDSYRDEFTVKLNKHAKLFGANRN